MSQQNVALVVSQFEAVNSGDFTAVTDRWAEDVTLIAHGELAGLVGVSGHNVAVGKEAVALWFADWFEQFAHGYRFEIDESRDLGDRVVIVATHYGRGRASGVPVTIQSGYLYSLREGNVGRIELWDDRAGAFEAAGLGEQAVSKEHAEIVRRVVEAVNRRDQKHSPPR